MPDIKPTVTEVVDKLEALGSSRQIADFFQQQGIKAHQLNAYSCAVAEYTKAQTGLPLVAVNVVAVRGYPDSYTNDEQAVSIIGGPVQDFVREFDMGYYPELVAND